MRLLRLVILFVLAAPGLAEAVETKPLVIGHRGASGYRPEHTRAAYQLAIEQGADYIEPDLVITKDGVLIARHENELSDTTDVASRFPDRKKIKSIDGRSVTGWFSEDFTLAEIKTLRAKERLSGRSQTYNFKEPILTFAEVIEIAKKEGAEKKRVIGVYPEIKHPTYFRDIKLPLEPALAKELKAAGLATATAPVIVQSFELSGLKEMKKLAPVKLVFLIGDPNERPFDHVKSGDKRTYADLVKPESLVKLKDLLFGIGPHKRLIVPENAKGELQPVTPLLKAAHSAGLKVHVYTFRSESHYLAKAYGGDPQKEYAQFYTLGVDGVFSDFPDHAVQARKAATSPRD